MLAHLTRGEIKVPIYAQVQCPPPAARQCNAVANQGTALVISCEHGGNRIPTAFHKLFAEQQPLLGTHRGYDLGALIMAREMAKVFRAPLIASTVSRLLVDLNRSEHHPQLHGDSVRQSPAALRQRILAEHYHPYRQALERTVADGISRYGQVLHVSVHSFTPIWNDEVRKADVGLLYDPSRPGERSHCRQWQHVLATIAPSLQVRRNYPYRGSDDGLTRHLRQRYSADAYVGIELEINQSHTAQPTEAWRSLRAAVIDSLREALASPHRSTPSSSRALVPNKGQQ